MSDAVEVFPWCGNVYARRQINDKHPHLSKNETKKTNLI